jgi:hypothetical protein
MEVDEHAASSELRGRRFAAPAQFPWTALALHVDLVDVAV